MAARSSSLGGGVISTPICDQAKGPGLLRRSKEGVSRRLLIAAALLALVPAGAAAAATRPDAGAWAAPQIRTVTAAGLMGTTDAAGFRPGDPLTAQTLENLVFGLKQVVFPPDPTPQPPAPLPAPNPATVPAVTDPAQTTPAPTTPTVTTTTPTTTTTPAPAPVPVPPAPPGAAPPAPAPPA
jgi:hypothetical protein